MDNTLIISFFISLSVLTWQLLARKKAKQFPPGPRPLPIIGNISDVPAVHSYFRYTEWRKVYGDIVYLKLFNSHLVIVNSREVARDLLDKRSRIYSSRPVLPAVDMTGWSFNMAFIPYGDLWRRHRSTYTHVLRPQAVNIYQPLQLKYTRILLRSLLENPDKHRNHFKLFSAGVILDATYGRHIESRNDPLIVMGDEAVEIITNAMIPGANIINVLPILRHLPTWLPGAAFHRIAAHCRNLNQQLFNNPFEVVKNNMRTNSIAYPCMASILLERHYANDGSKEDEEIMKGVTTTTYGAGLESTETALASFIFAMVLHPEVQKKAQNEIISVIGSDRLPTFGDRKSLPYVEAVYREVMRYFPVSPVGIPHMTSEDDVYRGYTIPAGTTVLPNVWAMTHDERVYSEPLVFKPERFLRSDGTINDDDEILAFGFGRRVCVGRHFANNTVWVALASILCAFTISPVDGAIYPEDLFSHFTSSFFSRPKHFECIIAPRDDAISHFIREEVIDV